MIVAEIGQGDLLLSFFWFFCLILWFWLLITVFGDLFSDKDESTGAKVLWTLFVLLVPYLGVFVYLIARGHGMGERAAARQQQAEAQFKQYVKEAGGGTADELAKLAELKNNGTITEAEFEAQKAKLLA
jgi:hypothetical protein